MIQQNVPGVPSAGTVQEDSAPRSPRGPVLLWAGLVLLLALLGCYLFLCQSVNPEQVLPRTRVVYYASTHSPDASGHPAQALNLSGLDRKSAVSALEEDFHSRFDSLAVTVRACGEDYTVSLGNALAIDAQSTADKALSPSQAPFLCRGMSKLRSLFTWRTLELEPTVGSEEQLRKDLRDSGLMDVDTTRYTSCEVKGDELVIHKGVTGQSVDEKKLVQQLTDVVHAGSYDQRVDSAMVDGQVNLVDWSAVEKDVCREPQNAALKLSKDRREYELLDSVRGVSIDSAQAQQVLEAAEEGNDVSVGLSYQEPEITTDKLEENLFKDKLGTYTTTVTGTSNRISNVRLAAEKCNGVILCQGDKFSYNDTLGERTKARGFKTAGAYLNGATVQEVGGGICQISSTLYAACLDANLKILERHNHTFASSYIGLGLDATVSWGGPDYQFQNDKDYPIRIEARYSGNKATVSVWGTRTDKLSVEMVSETLETIPYPTIKKKSSGLKKGKTRVEQQGSDGYKVQTYRKVYDDGKLVSSEKEAYSVYTPHEKIIYVGTKGSKKTSKSKKSSKKSSKKKSSKKKKK